MKKSALAYLSLIMGLLIPPLLLPMVGVLCIIVLSSYGQRHWKSTMIKLHVVRRFRAKGQNRVDVFSEPPLSLFAQLVRATGVRSLEDFARVTRRTRIIKRFISGAMIVFLGAYAASIPFLFSHFWLPTPIWETLVAAQILTLSLYGMLTVLMILIGTEAITALKTESARPVYVGREELEAVASAPARQ